MNDVITQQFSSPTKQTLKSPTDRTKNSSLASIRSSKLENSPIKISSPKNSTGSKRSPDRSSSSSGQRFKKPFSSPSPRKHSIAHKSGLTQSPRKSEFCASRSSHPDFDVSFDNIEYDFEAAASSRDQCYITLYHCDFCL